MRWPRDQAEGAEALHHFSLLLVWRENNRENLLEKQEEEAGRLSGLFGLLLFIVFVFLRRDI